MNFFEQINELEDRFNTNQINFWKSCKWLFNKIDERSISPNSRFIFESKKLEIFLSHSSDVNTQLAFIVDEYEVYIVVAGIGKSMLMVFPHSEGHSLFEQTSVFVESCLLGLYCKKRFFSRDKNLIKEELIWRDNKFKKTTFYIGTNVFLDLFKSYSLTQEINYSSFF